MLNNLKRNALPGRWSMNGMWNAPLESRPKLLLLPRAGSDGKASAQS